jgi:type IV pilus assembly protein PilY1
MKTFQTLVNLIAAAVIAVYSISTLAGTLSQLPLSLKSGVPPNVMFALSVEFPTAITPAYQDASSYSRNNTYLGYFDDQKCYYYDSSLSSGSVSGWFYPAALSTTVASISHACVSGWSGNFLNWASMAGLDEFRFAMTGGNRVVDLPNSGSNPGGLTVLERSYQSSQGSNFMTKTFTEDGYSTGFASGATLSIVNSGRGVQMVVTNTSGGTTAGTATCVGPQLVSGSFNCGGGGTSYGYTLSNGDTTNCGGGYTGTGSSASPYTCSSFNNSSGGLPVATPTGSTSSVLVPSPTAGSVTLSCPSNSFTSSPYACTAALSNGATGTCSSWGGSGTAGSPYECTGFGTFSGGESFAINIPGGASGTASATDTNSIPYTNSSVTCTVSGTTPTTTCSSLDGNGTTATCSTYITTGSGSSTRYYCTSFALSGSTDTFSSATNPATTFTTVSSKKYYTTYTIINNKNSSVTVYYKPSYVGNYGVPKYYYSTYNVTIGSGANTFNVRAKVCDTSIGIESNCQLYSDGSTYKPTGVLQSNTNMRYGVTSYFMNNGGVANSGGGITDIDDAVLRAKLKYLAPTQYLSAGAFTPNAAAEWSDTDGTFVNNPDSGDTATMTTPWGSPPANSGVINYINKFGATARYYKTYDNIGKLYYETLRYLRGGYGITGGKAPTTAFYNGAKLANSDGFPVITTWDDPVKYSCQKNYIITMGDAHTWCDKRLPGGTYTSNGNAVCNAYTDGNSNAHLSDLGSLSGDTGISGLVNGQTISSASGTANATNAVGGMEGMGNIATTQTGAGGASYSMAGLAAWAATNNIRPDMATSATSPMNVKSFIIDVQEAKDCSYDKQFWLTAKYGDPSYYTSNATTGMMWNNSSSWYNSILGNSFTCSSNGPPNYASSTLMMKWPKNLLRASDPVSMIASVKTAIQSIAAEQGDEAALAQSAGTLNTGTGAYIYQASYNSGGWSGDLQAFVIDQSGNIGTASDWTASHLLPTPSNRKVFSFNRTTNAGIQFDLDGGNGLSYFDSYQQGLLDQSDLGVVDSFGADRVKYIRGDMTKEAYLPSTTGAATPNSLSNHGWRSRIAVGSACDYSVTPYTCPSSASYTTGPSAQLGDVVYSNPLYVGPPSEPLPDPSYKTFALGKTARVPMIYVGGNDGMLHAYNASYYLTSTGLPAHCPQMSGGSLVSPQPASCMSGGTAMYSGTEVFGYVPYATFPKLNNLMSPNYSHAFYADGTPVSADVCVSTGGAAYCDGTNDSWKTLLVGGLNAGGRGIYAMDITDPVASFSASTVLWEFTNKDDADLGYTFSKPIVIKLNNKRWAVIFGNGFNSVNAIGNPGNNNAYLFVLYVNPGLSVSQAWVQGTNYFKIALTSPGTPNNASNGLAAVAAIDTNLDGAIDFVYGGDRNGNLWKIDITSSTPSSWAASYSGTPLFTAKDGAGHLQQITTAPKVGMHPSGGYMVTFGTGSWIDRTDPDPQSGSTFYKDTLYGIWDQNTGLTASPVSGRSSLQRQATLDTYSVNSSGVVCTAGTANCTTYNIQSSCIPNYTITPMGASGNASTLCPTNVPNVTPTTSLAALANTGQQFGWYYDLQGNGERSHSDPPNMNGSTIQYTTLTPSVDPCTGNTTGYEYDFSYLTGGSPDAPIFLIPGSNPLNTAGYISWTAPNGTVIQVVASGQSIIGGAALNPVSFNASPPASVIAAAAGMPTTMPAQCAAGSCTQATNNYIPGWGFLMNLSSGPLASTGKWVLSCYPQQSGGTQKNCQWRHRTGKFGRLQWKQVN